MSKPKLAIPITPGQGATLYFYGSQLVAINLKARCRHGKRKYRKDEKGIRILICRACVVEK